jgi:hypothetical protein
MLMTSLYLPFIDVEKRSIGKDISKTISESFWRRCGEKLMGRYQSKPTCIGDNITDGKFCMSAEVCVQRSRGIWIPAYSFAETNCYWLPPLNEPAAAMSGLPVHFTSALRFPIIHMSRYERDSAVHVGIPAVIGSIYECGHLSHFLFNGLFPISAAALRVKGGSSVKPAFIATSVHGQCVPSLFASLNAIVAETNTQFLNLENPESLPLQMHCFGPAIFGLRRSCMHNECARTLSSFEAAFASNSIKAYFGINQVPSAVLPPRLTIVQRKSSRVIMNLNAVVYQIKKLWTDIRMTCNLVTNQSFFSATVMSSICPNSSSDFDVQVVELEGLEFAEQVRIFAKTDILLAVHGNALGNAAWMPHDSSVIEAFMFEFSSKWFEEPITDIFKLHYSSIRCTSQDCLPPLSKEHIALETEAKSDNLSNKLLGLIKKRNVTINPTVLSNAILASIEYVYQSRLKRQVNKFENQINKITNHSCD